MTSEAFSAARLRDSIPIRTARLRLRPWRVADLDAYWAIRGDPSVAQYLYDEPRSREACLRQLELTDADGLTAGQSIHLAAERADDRAVVGDVSVVLPSAPHLQAEIGYLVAPEYQGNGYATEAARAIVDLAFAYLGAHRVSGRLDGRNVASARVLERLGMRQEAHLIENEFVKGEWTDEIVFAMLRREWEQREPRVGPSPSSRYAEPQVRSLAPP